MTMASPCLERTDWERIAQDWQESGTEGDAGAEE